MFSKIPPLEIDPKDPFRGDALFRQSACEELAKLIADSGTKTPFVLAVNASWGNGKTVFLQMLQAVCKAEPRNLPTVFFNAWETDFHNDALAAMIGEVGGQIPADPKSELAKAAGSVKKAGRKVLSRRGLGEMLKGILKSAGSAAGLGALADGTLASLKKFDPAAEYRAYRDALREFKDSLSDYAKKSGKPLVFFVDELDRCRPVFAVEVLEKIKHIFDVEGVFFVVAVNKAELVKTIRSVYGDIDADVYLGKFFDKEYLLMSPPIANSGAILQKLPEHFRPQDELASMSVSFGLSVREQEKVLRVLADVWEAERKAEEPVKFAHHRDKITILFAILLVVNSALFRKFLPDSGVDYNVALAKLTEFCGNKLGLSEESQRTSGPACEAYVEICAIRYRDNREGDYRAKMDAFSQNSPEEISYGDPLGKIIVARAKNNRPNDTPDIHEIVRQLAPLSGR